MVHLGRRQDLVHEIKTSKDSRQGGLYLFSLESGFGTPKKFGQ